MKIEVEYEEVSYLKSTIERLESENKQLKEDLEKLDTNKLKSDAVSLSYTMFEEYMNRVFVELGFEDKQPISISSFTDNLPHWLGKNWWESKRLGVTIGATITNKFREAFIRFGILPESNDPV